MKKIYFLAAAALALTACDNDNSSDTPVESSSTILRISASIEEETSLTRAQGGTWDEGDDIGIIATVGELVPESFHPYINLLYSAKSAGSNVEFERQGDELLFYNHLTISGYYPYRGSEGTAPGEADGYFIKTDTRIDKQFDNNKAIDFLHAAKTGIKLADAERVELSFSHKMTNLTFTFMSNTTAKNKVDVAKLARYQIEGLELDGTFNTLTGECIVSKGTDVDVLAVAGLAIKTEEGQTPPESRVMKSLIVFPQTLADNNAVTLRMFLDEAQNGKEEDYQIYSCPLKFKEDELVPGHHYNFKVNITKAGLALGEITISDWSEGTHSTVVATIDGNEDPEFDPEDAK